MAHIDTLVASLESALKLAKKITSPKDGDEFTPLQHSVLLKDETMKAEAVGRAWRAETFPREPRAPKTPAPQSEVHHEHPDVAEARKAGKTATV